MAFGALDPFGAGLPRAASSLPTPSSTTSGEANNGPDATDRRVVQLLASYFVDSEVKHLQSVVSQTQTIDKIAFTDSNLKDKKSRNPGRECWRKVVAEGWIPLLHLSTFSRIRNLLRLIRTDTAGTDANPPEPAAQLEDIVRRHCQSFLELRSLEEILGENQRDEPGRNILLQGLAKSVWARRRVTHGGSASVVDGLASGGEWVVHVSNLPPSVTPLDLTTLLLPHSSPKDAPHPPRRVNILSPGRYAVYFDNPGAVLRLLAADIRYQDEPVLVGLPGSVTCDPNLTDGAVETEADWSTILTTDFVADRISLLRVEVPADPDTIEIGRPELERALAQFAKVAAVTYRTGDVWAIVRWNATATAALKTIRNATGDHGKELIREGDVEATVEISGTTVKLARPTENQARLWWAVARAREITMPKVQPMPRPKGAKKKAKPGKRGRDSEDEEDIDILTAGFSKAGFVEREKPPTPVKPAKLGAARDHSLDGDGKCPDPAPAPQANVDSLLSYFSDPGPNRNRLKNKKRKFRTKKRKTGDPGGLVSLFGQLGVGEDEKMVKARSGELNETQNKEDEEWETEESDNRPGSRQSTGK